jgi:NDP-sugar pyrophosphorylase family protein
MNSDLICDIDYAKIFKSHESSNSLMTVITKQKKFPVDFGVIKTQDNRILEFKEKPIIKRNVCIGINLFNKKILKYIPKNKKFSFDDLINYLLNKKITINSYSFNGYWLDLGRPEDYDEANDNYKSLFKKLSIE